MDDIRRRNSNEGPRRGGRGSNSGLTRQNSNSSSGGGDESYRRIVRVVDDGDEDTHSKDPPRGGIRRQDSSHYHRSQEARSDRPFRSSLQASIRQELPPYRGNSSGSNQHSYTRRNSREKDNRGIDVSHRSSNRGEDPSPRRQYGSGRSDHSQNRRTSFGQSDQQEDEQPRLFNSNLSGRTSHSRKVKYVPKDLSTSRDDHCEGAEEVTTKSSLERTSLQSSLRKNHDSESDQRNDGQGGKPSSLRSKTVEKDVSSTGFKSSLRENLQGAQSSQAPTVSAPAPPSFRSSLASAITSEKKISSKQNSSPSGRDDAEKSRLAAEKLKERFQSRGIERGTSLSQLISRMGSSNSEEKDNETTFKSSLQNSSSVSSTWESSFSPSSMKPEKQKRVQEFYAKLEAEEKQKEDARRNVPFKSSLLSAINQPISASVSRFPPSRSIGSVIAPPPIQQQIQPKFPAASVAQASGFKSSLRASMSMTSSFARGNANKITYSVEQLRELRQRAIAPKALIDMTIVQREQVRDPSSVQRGLISSRTIAARERERVTRAGKGLISPPIASKSSFRLERKEAKRGNRSEMRGAKGRGGDGRGRGGRRGRERQPEPVFDGPVEPLVLSENRWVPKKGKSALESTLSIVKGLLNKLTREKFKKLTDELVSVEIQDLETLSSIVSVIMNKALEEPNFSDVYADLSKEFHVRTGTKVWHFLRTVENIDNHMFYWTAVRDQEYIKYSGPLPSIEACSKAATETTVSFNGEVDIANISSTPPAPEFYLSHSDLIAIVKGKDGLYFSNKKRDKLSEMEPLIGGYPSMAQAYQAAVKATSFKRLLVTRCQDEFQKEHKQEQTTTDSSEEEQRKQQILATQQKRMMLGNIRFIGELFKVDMLNQAVVQRCIVKLLGLKLVKTPEGTDAAETIRFPDEEDVEALCKFLATVGKKFDTPKTTSIMNIVISRMVELSEDKKLLSRGRFLLKDVLEMRDYMWEPRRQELQQKTLEEVRKEAERLQKLGKNAQHDNFSSRRKKTSISSAQLAKQSSNLLLKKSTSPKESGRALGSAAKGEEVKNQQTTSSTPPSPSLEPFESGDLSSEDRSRYTARIKNIINEYLSIEDLEEASACVREELPLASHADFAEQAINIALDGKEKERESAVQLLVGLYEKGALDATSIQNAIVLVVEFLEDMKIDIPLIHEYSALIYGRLIAAGCFGFSWMLGSLEHVTECGLTSLIFAEVIGVIETEHGNDEDAEEEEEAEEAVASIIRMLTDEEITPEMVLPSSKRTPENIHQFLEEHELEEYFNDEEEEDVSEEEEDVEEYDPEMETRMKNTLDEYLSVKDFEELLTCLNEFQSQTQRANAKFAQMAILKAVDARENVREEIAQTLIKLVEVNQLNASEVEQAFEPVLLEYDDFLVDIPKIADNLCQLWLTFFIDKLLTFDWLFAVIDHLIESGSASSLIATVLNQMEQQIGEEQVSHVWKETTKSDIQLEKICRDERCKEQLGKWMHLLLLN